MRPFQAIILGIFGFFAVVGVVAFATFRGPGSEGGDIPVLMWGTLPAEIVEDTLSVYKSEGGQDITLFYEEFREDEFDTELVEALAEGRGPDMILLPHDGILRHQAKLFSISFESYPERAFKDTFIELGELYVTPSGIMGLPFIVDPLVLYWNRDLLASSGRALPPKTWEELLVATSELTVRDERNNILQSAIALGEFQNITHAKEILTMLFLQAGEPIVSRNPTGELSTTLGSRFGFAEVPVESALRFYTEFADPVKALYSWNRSLPNSKDAFLAGDVALYLGRAGELGELQTRNPNLNFDVTMVPQIAEATIKKTAGRMYALAILRTSPKITPAFRAAVLMTEPDFLKVLERVSGLPPVRRDMLAGTASGAASQTFYRSALIADGFLDPNRETTTTIFKRMVEDVTAGREPISQSIINARESLVRLLP